jgi:hypothetical protein
MKKLHLTLFSIVLTAFTLQAQDTLTVHASKVKFEDGLFMADGSIIKKDVYTKLKAEQEDFLKKSKGRICWVRRLDKNDKVIEQGLFCDGTTSVGNLIRYNSKGQITYKKLHSGTRITSCGQSENGTKATEEAFDLVNNLRIYGTYENGQKHGQFLYYEKGTVVGAEAFENGKLIKRRGKVFSINDDGSIKVMAMTN